MVVATFKFGVLNMVQMVVLVYLMFHDVLRSACLFIEMMLMKLNLACTSPFSSIKQCFPSCSWSLFVEKC